MWNKYKWNTVVWNKASTAGTLLVMVLKKVLFKHYHTIVSDVDSEYSTSTSWGRYRTIIGAITTNNVVVPSQGRSLKIVSNIQE